MFGGCSSLISLDLRSFNTSNVNDMNYMFGGCSSLISLDLSSFNTSNVIYMNYMFDGCSSLIRLNLRNFIISSSAKIDSMFDKMNQNAIYCFNEATLYKVINELNKTNLYYKNNCSDICFNKNKKIIKEKNKCISDCKNDDIYKYEYNNICYAKCPNGTNHLYNTFSCINNWNLENYFKGEYNNIKNKNNLTKDQIINNIKNSFLNGNTNLYNILQNNNNNLLLRENDIIYQITTLQNLNENNNISTINLGNCENILRTIYDIDKSIPLPIFKVDYFMAGLLIPVIGYEIFNLKNNSLLDLKYCSNETTNINIPISIKEENIFKHNPKSDYYTDDCIPYTTENGTDILINDRQNEFINNNMSLCENNCSFEEYKTDKKMVVCKCEIKTKQIVISELNNNINILNNNFTNNSSSTITMKCYYILFSIDGLKENIEHYILIFIIILYIIFSILFYKCGYPLLNNDIKEIVELKEENNNINMNATIESKEKKEIMKINKNSKNKNGNINKKKIDSKDNSKSFASINIKKNKINFKKENESNQKSMMYTDYELNSFSYKEALEKDKRTYFDYYISLLRNKHPILFAFCPINDYNSRIIKLSIFLLFFSILYTTNTFFFDEDLIHQIYEVAGNYNIFYLTPFMIYSFIISHILYLIIKNIFLTERNIVEIKN